MWGRHHVPPRRPVAPQALPDGELSVAALDAQSGAHARTGAVIQPRALAPRTATTAGQGKPSQVALQLPSRPPVQPVALRHAVRVERAAAGEEDLGKPASNSEAGHGGAVSLVRFPATAVGARARLAVRLCNASHAGSDVRLSIHGDPAFKLKSAHFAVTLRPVSYCDLPIVFKPTAMQQGSEQQQQQWKQQQQQRHEAVLLVRSCDPPALVAAVRLSGESYGPV